ncbi:hypothetical protein BLS_003154 [Venturia inaequalis]|uniref:Bromo domain-containing protein n=1 Tax=Venturia inaequalis TaxID=5025 RepID=A0A8H3UPV0_VENIN|nr:hypothetical protein BLS_003154 [Venturia inaequalis]
MPATPTSPPQEVSGFLARPKDEFRWPPKLAPPGFRQPNDQKEREEWLARKQPPNEHGMPSIRRDSSAHNNDPVKRANHQPKRYLSANGPRPKKKEEHQAFAYPFMVPVDPVALNTPYYHKVIKKPVSPSTFHHLNLSLLFTSRTCAYQIIP